MVPFAAYLRTSTDNHQSPADSAAWQLRLASQLITGVDGRVVATYHDVDQSRSLPWERRPEATRLLAQLRNPARGWDNLVIAEPQRAFAGNQFGLVFPVLVHYGVHLWVPEVGGRVDPDSEAHDLLMSLFGGLAKAERNRIRHRVRVAMAAHATTGRWLGGRPPYGYTLGDLGPHPNPEKAAVGIKLHCLEPDPATAPVVARVFRLYADDGFGFKAIARQLTDEGVASPSAHDPIRNPHRPGHAWAASAVRAILRNPRYLGRQVYGRQQRQEVLLDPAQPALGHATRMRWSAADTWVTSTDLSHPPLVDVELWERAQAVMVTRDPQVPTGTPRATPGRYPLAGMITCHHCGRRMQGSHTRGHPFYRCRLSNSDYAAPPVGHPITLAVREDRILPVLDTWLIEMFSPDRIDALAAKVVAADAATVIDPRTTAARQQAAQARHKIERHLAALEAGLDPALVAARTRQAQAELAAAEAVLSSASTAPEPLTLDEVVDTLQAVRALPDLLNDADPQIRHEIYRSLGVTLRYRREGPRELVKVESAPKGVDLDRVGGGT